MKYSIMILPQARRFCKNITSRSERNKISDAIEQLAENPYPEGSKKLKDTNLWRITVSDYRIIYSIEKDELVIMVVKIGKRNDVYKAIMDLM